MKIFIKVIILILGVSFIITGCSRNEIKDEPKFGLKFNVSNLTEEEYKLVGTKELKNPKKDDFKNIEFTLDVEHSNKISNRNISVPSIKEVIQKQYKDRYWFGKGDSEDNKEANFASYGEKIVFYSKGLKEEEIKEIFKSSEVKISWSTDNEKSKEKIFNLGDIIEFEQL